MGKILLTPLLLTGLLAPSSWAAPGDYDPSYDQGGGYGAATLDERVAKLEKKLSGDSLMDMLNRVEQLQSDVLRLRGEVEDLTHHLETLKRQQKDMYLDLDRRLQAATAPPPPPQPAEPAESATPSQEEAAPTPQQAPAPAIPAPAPITAPAVVPAPPAATPAQPPAALAPAKPVEPPRQPTPASVVPTKPATVPASAPSADSEARQAAYQKGFNLLKDGKYPESIKEFKSFLSAYPKGEYSDNAAYWLAEAHYVNRDFAAAREAFRKLVKEFPQAAKVSDAQLKLGYIDYDTGQWLNARQTFSDVIKRYPDSSAAKLAQKRLDKMKQEGH